MTTETLGSTTGEQVMPVGPMRSVVKVVRAIEQAEGAGARVRRSIGTAGLKNLSPFLMLDHFMVPEGAGFSDHPHRGQETVTYMLEGSFQHEDFAGHAGTIGPGSLQFMRAGRGVQHAEMPLHDSDVVPRGLQLWVDLPAAHKMSEPTYKEMDVSEIPTVKPDELVEIKVITGEAHGVVRPQETVAGVWYLDVAIKAGGTLRQKLPAGWNALLYTLEGQVTIDEGNIPQYNTVVFSRDGEGVIVVNPGNDTARFVLIAGEPLDQEVVQYGPFVMDTKAGIQQAFFDYQSKTNGFERAASWRSKIAAHIM